MMRGVFQWLDAHPAFYWVMLVVALTAWVARCRTIAARSEAGVAVRWDGWTWLVVSAVVVAGRWPELFVAHGVTEEEARVVLGAQVLAGDFRPFRGFMFSGGGPLASAALLPTHWLGVALDYFNARLVALLCDLVTLGCLGWVLGKRVGARVSVLALGALALLLAWPGGQLAGALAQHLCLGLSAVAFVILTCERWRGIDAAAMGAGFIVGLMPWVHRDAVPGIVLCLAVGGWLLGEFSRVRTFLGAAIYSLVVCGAWIWGTGAWADCWEFYLPGGAGGGSFVGWWLAVLVLVVVVAGTVGLGRWITRQNVVRLAGGMAAVGLAAIALAGRPAMLGQLAEHWRRPRIGTAAEIRELTRPAEAVAVWGGGAAALVEAGRGAAISFLVDAQSEVTRQERWFDLLRRREPGVLLVAAGPRPEKLQTLLQDHYRWESAGDQGQIYLRNARMFARRLGEPGTIPISRQSLAVAEAFGGSVAEVGEGRISTHAPARLVARVPAGARRVAGIFGFYPDAYRHPGRTTDGGKFLVIWWRGTQRETAQERWLTPGHVVGDRGAQEFDLEVPSDVDAVEFNVESGLTKSFDWAYWGELRFSSRR